MERLAPGASCNEYAAMLSVCIGEIDVEVEIVVPDRRAQQEGLRAVYQQLEVRKIARVAVEHAIGAAGGRADIAMAVEHGKGVVVLERSPRPGRGTGHGDVKGRFARGRLGLGHCLSGYQQQSLLARRPSVP